MRQVWITRKGPPEVLQVREAPDPEAGPGQVRIRVRAAGINFADLLARVGLYPDAPKPPCVVGYEVSGTVDQIGAGVTGLAPNDRVMALPAFGGYSDVLVLGAEDVTKLPEDMSFQEGAALPVVYLTAHHMMLFTGNLRRGAKVLIHSAAGGVGIAAIQLAQTRDCEIFGTASPSKHAFLREQGVAHPIDSGRDVAAQVRNILNNRQRENRGLDLILDPVGGRSWVQGYELLGPCGRIVMFGMSSASTGERRHLIHAALELARVKRYHPLNLMNDNKEIAGVNIGHLFNRPDLLRPQLAALVDLYRHGKVRPFVDRTFPFAEAPAAHRYIHERKAKGKVLLVP